MSDDTPTTERVQDLYSWAYAWRTDDGPDETDLSGVRERQRAEFASWLVAHDAEVRAGLLPEGAEWFPDEGGIVWQGRVYYPADYVMSREDIAAVRADQQEKDAQIVKAEIERLEVVKGTYAQGQRHALGVVWAAISAGGAS